MIYFILGIITTFVLIVLCAVFFYLGVKYQTRHKEPIKEPEQNELDARKKMNDHLNALMNYDIAQAYKKRGEK